MTKRDFEMLADALYTSQLDSSEAHPRQWLTTMHAISRACAASNPRFDSDRFEHRALFGHNVTRTCCGPRIDARGV